MSSCDAATFKSVILFCRAQAVTIANALIALTISGASLGDVASLTELVSAKLGPF